MPVPTVPQNIISIEINALIKLYFNEHEETYNLNVYNILYIHNIHCGYPLTGRRHRNLFSGP